VVAAKPQRRWWAGLVAVSLLAAGCGASRAAAGHLAPSSHRPLASFSSSCTYSPGSSDVQGTPDVATPPALESVSLQPQSGGLMVTYKFRKPLVLAPEGVYFAWVVVIYRHRSDAARYNTAITLQVEDRGAGWEPVGWTVAVQGPNVQSLLQGSIASDASLDQFQEFFPAGRVDLRPPFYWYASQVVYRAYMPEKSSSNPQDFNIYGTITTDCPAGIRRNPYSLPDASRLVVAGP